MNTTDQVAQDELRQDNTMMDELCEPAALEVKNFSRRPSVPTPPLRRSAPTDLDQLAASVEAGNQMLVKALRPPAHPRVEPLRESVLAAKARRLAELRETDTRRQASERRGRSDVLDTLKMHRINAAHDAERDREMVELRARNRELQLKLRRPVNPAAIGGARPADVRAQAVVLARKAQDNYLRTGETSYKGVSLTELQRRAMSPDFKAINETSGPDGGFLIMPQYEQGPIEKLLYQYVPMRQHAKVQQINAYTYKKPVRVSTGGARWGSELASGGETNTPKFALLDFPAHNLYAEPAVSSDILDDSSYDLEAAISDGCVEDFSLSESLAWISGDGVEKPWGILGYGPSAYVTPNNWSWGKVVYGATGVDAGLPAVGAADPIIAMPYRLKQVYRQNGKYMGNRLTIGLLKTLKDSSGRYIWGDGDMSKGQPNTFNGYPYIEAEQMPDYNVAGVYGLAFADWERFYIIVDRMGMNVLRDQFTAYPQIVFKTRKRVGGGIQNFEAGNLLRFSAT